MRRIIESYGARFVVVALGSVATLAAANTGCGSDADREDATASDTAMLGTDAGGRPATPTVSGKSPSDLEWPNAASRANSDPWIAEHHGEITRMKPKILALNFAMKKGFVEQTNSVAEGLRQMSRYHAYSNDSAAPFLDPELEFVDLATGPALASAKGLNAATVPLKCVDSTWYNFDYKALFTAAFAAQIGGDLGERVKSGEVHEVWVRLDGNPDPYVCPNGFKVKDLNIPELLESKQVYDANDQPVANTFERCAGNGCLGNADFDAFKKLGRSFRVVFINASRGPGCALHSIGHGIEWTGGYLGRSPVPNFARVFEPFARFDLDERGAPFRHWYEANASITFDSPEVASWTAGKKSGEIDDYGAGCGNVHFPPNGTKAYEYTSKTVVRSGCESYGLDAKSGAVEGESFTAATVESRERAFPDCGGGWLVYWGQSMPGLGNAAKDPAGAPIKNWWPYRYY